MRDETTPALDTSLGTSLRASQKREKLDAACKSVLAEKQILAWILRACAAEYANYSIEEIIPCIEGTPEIGTVPVEKDLTGKYIAEKITGQQNEDPSEYEGTIRYDIRFVSSLPNQAGTKRELIVNVEAQNNFNPGYNLITRGIYYCGRMLSAQKGTVFGGSDYDRIQKVQSIWLCIRPNKQWAGSITSYSLAEKNLLGECKSDLAAYDKMNVTLICLGNKTAEKNVISLLDTVLGDMGLKEKRKKLEDDFSIKTTESLQRRLSDMCNYSVGVFNDGHEKGRELAMLDSVKNLMASLNMTAGQAMDALKVPLEEREKYLALLEKEQG